MKSHPDILILSSFFDHVFFVYELFLIITASEYIQGYSQNLTFKVLKDALAHSGPYQTLMSARYIDPGRENTVRLPATIQI